ncbi:MAG: penicillin-binding protein 2 [Candidatus Omnitrophica bacterium]|nr:penicillin-binding protein 2 [Candidatus Omnitrophota bacterium]
MYKRAQKVRLAIVYLSYLILLLIILFHLFNIQVLNNHNYIKLADSQHHLTLKLYPQRGLIYDRNHKVLALSLKVPSVYAVPRAIVNKEEVADALSSVLSLDYDSVLEKLKRDKSFIWIKRRVSDQEAENIKALKLFGVEITKESKRYYPNNGLAAHILGFAGMDELGLDGVELKYNSYLKGEPGKRSLLRDAKQRMLPAFEYEYIPAVNGYNLVLTIDEVIQHIVEQTLDRNMEKNKALAASVVVMNPQNGEIYALASRPGYDLNNFAKANAASRRNRTISDYFEPGSTFKVITASAALEENIVKTDDMFFCENGAYSISRHILHDHRPHGNLTFVEVIEKSSNIGTVKIAQKMGGKILNKYVKKFGFGQKTGIDLPGETQGFLRPLENWSKLSIAAIPIGQEIGVSAIQMARAMSAVVNGGYTVNPYIVSEIIDNNNEIIKSFKNEKQGSVISEKTSATMREILKGVVENGTGRAAKIKDYEAGGKTGTAQKIDSSGKYSQENYVASFIGFTPVEDPQFVIAVVFDEPRPFYYGGTVSAPVFKEIAEKILKYMNVPKTKKDY